MLVSRKTVRPELFGERKIIDTINPPSPVGASSVITAIGARFMATTDELEKPTVPYDFIE